MGMTSSILATPARATYTVGRRFVMAMVLIVAQVADLVTTQLLIDAGGRERNPIADAFLANGSLEAVKLGLAGVVGTLMLVAPLRRRAEQTVNVVAVTYTLVLATHVTQLALGAG
ncbi:MAG TPA: DUF5658 family protein [Acidimicrobiales bacterium]|nr:DUF5658 family protein [Acidimicrobiales bacterium]